jgi:hypothetical protein
MVLSGATSSIGAGAAISEGKKMRELTATKATTNTKTINKGAIYCRKNAMGVTTGMIKIDEKTTEFMKFSNNIVT